MSDSPITIVGNLTRDPEIKFVASGRCVAQFSVAVNRRWLNKQTNEWEEEASFFNVTAWSELAENIGESLVKGNRVVVKGRLEQRSWETESGESRSTVELIADDVGASIKWATCDIARNAPKGSKPVANQPPAEPGTGPDEEPF